MFTQFLKITLTTAAILSSVVACTPQVENTAVLGKDSSAIIGGVQVAKSDVISKSTIGLVIMFQTHEGQQGEFLCTATLIREDVLLTAAHCIPNAKEFAQVGIAIAFSTDLNTMDEFKIRYAAGVIAHPYYNEGNVLGQDTHDLALIRFEGGLPEGYEVVKMLEDERILKKGASVTLAGYGLNKTDGINTENDNTLRKTNVKIYDIFGKHEILLDQRQGSGSCHGDSGGPAFIEIDGAQYLWGVTSRGAGKGGVDDCSLFSVYTKVKSEKAFISAALEYLDKNKGKK